ncbi:RagB/SusD family nutrient uptake outer membrane protein [Chitinophaga silvatica]|uniref:RagB/SusD family nutrient uptake outer membrane protein n=1 Tax=Chitinophaga silvatica TaxID=2282649 RepID=A0A3E1YFX4_9BACT|nr:RagB/SusD family nutrient uptake outer membrane protein [Chitinophaga silvatica]RFS26266.1 RagB/SusD family nutrient uptake outer membrane protein [Chitinophaga silvatica]
MTLSKNILIAGLALLLFVPFTACKKLLDQTPINSPYAEVFWKNQQDAEQGAAGAYALVRKALTSNTEYNQYMSHFAYGSLAAFEFQDYDQYDVASLVKGGDGFNSADFIGSYLQPYHDWSPYYKIVAQTNIMLEFIPKIPDGQFTTNASTTRNRYLGEARFLRAFAYFYMLRLWGDVPLVLSYDPDPAHATNLPRTNEKVVLDSVITDLQKAVTLLPWDLGSANDKAVRATKGAAYGLLAHAYMWRNFLNKGANRADLTNAIAAIDAVEQSGKYMLLAASEYHKVFHGKSAEGVFEINMQAQYGEHQVAKGFYYNILKRPFLEKDKKLDAPNLDLISTIYDDEDDLRLKYFFYNLDASEQFDVTICKFAGSNGENVYHGQENIMGSVDANIIIMRYADLLLLRAEAYADLGNTGAAIKDMNTVRARSNAYALEEADYGDQYDLQAEVLLERSRELYAEGQRWYDLVRTGFLTEDWANGWLTFPQSRYEEEGWKWPVARSLFQTNNVLTQNKFWLGKVR